MKGELALLLKALAFAAHKHRDQRRKDPEASPYINHPIALADVLVNEGGVTDFEVLCAALLHDTVEDTATTHKELESEFGPRIAAIVAEVTDDTTLPKAERKRLQVDHVDMIQLHALWHPDDWDRVHGAWCRSVARAMTGSTVCWPVIGRFLLTTITRAEPRFGRENTCVACSIHSSMELYPISLPRVALSHVRFVNSEMIR